MDSTVPSASARARSGAVGLHSSAKPLSKWSEMLNEMLNEMLENHRFSINVLHVVSLMLSFRARTQTSGLSGFGKHTGC